MNDFNNEYIFLPNHTWVRKKTDTLFSIGITPYGKEQLGEIVCIEQPEEEIEYVKEQTFCSLETIKTVHDLIIPCDAKCVSFPSSEEIIEVLNFGDCTMELATFECASGAIEAIEKSFTLEEYESYIEGL